MLAVIVAVALQSPHSYQATLITSVPADFMRSYIRCTVLTEAETLAGFTCDYTGHHGETFAGKPFVWSKGRLHKLPMPPEAKHGHVYGGSDDIMLGSVTIDYKARPATWKPDPQLGWRKPHLKIISMKEGWASHLGPDGAIWVQNENQVARRLLDSKWEEVSLGKFYLQGFDAKGRMFGNRFTGITFGNRPHDTRAAIYDKGSWIPLKVAKSRDELGDDGYITAVNSRGDATGHCQNQAAIWRNRKVELFLNGRKRWSYAQDINDAGVVVGTCAVADIQGTMAFVWDKDKLLDLTKAVPGVSLDSAVQLNNHGSIAAIGYVERSAELYLLRPKPVK